MTSTDFFAAMAPSPACWGNPPAVGIPRIEDQGGLGVDEGPSGQGGNQLAVHHPDRALEDSAGDALQAPDLALGELPVGKEAGQLGAGARAAGRAVVGA